MADKKCPECPPVGAPAYMLTYGDMMTLLLTFFVLLLSFSSMQEAKFRRAIGSLKGALGVLPHEQSVVVAQEIPMPQLSNLQESEVSESLQELQETSADMDIAELIKLEVTDKGINMSLTDSMLFDQGSARIKVEILPFLMEISTLVKGWSNSVIISGHTDNAIIRTREFKSNYHLSFERAWEVMEFFKNQGGVDERKMIPIGHGKYNPIASNDTAEGRAKNRRVEIFIQYDSNTRDLPGNVKDYVGKFQK